MRDALGTLNYRGTKQAMLLFRRESNSSLLDCETVMILTVLPGRQQAMFIIHSGTPDYRCHVFFILWLWDVLPLLCYLMKIGKAGNGHEKGDIMKLNLREYIQICS